MNLREAFSMSWRAIRSSPLRSTLTTLGVIIGVAAVITFVILGASLQADVVGEVGGGEAERVYVWNGHEEAEARPGSGSRPAFTEHDLDQLRSMEGSRRSRRTVRSASTTSNTRATRSPATTPSPPTPSISRRVRSRRAGRSSRANPRS
ncbi:ABC transporter permease [Halalkalicoccus salilacus]|uniref:ABC transporter permease n=1 Tax=Halalkalicoccus sp. GCM10025704 TaxID=3252662 RepID=UPI0036133087